MLVLLNEDIPGLGDIGETVKVKPGYARNFLIPRGLAFETGVKTAKALAHKKRQVDAKKNRQKSDAETMGEKLQAMTVVTGLRVGGSGKVFGSIKAKDISEALLALGIDINRRRILLEEPIKKLGAHIVNVKLHADVQCELKVLVEKRDATEEDEKVELQEFIQTIEEKTATTGEEVPVESEEE